MKRGEVMHVMYLRHGRKAPKGSKLVKLAGNHGAYSALAILPKRAARKQSRA